jgi:multiple sugar transport system permease protein
MLQSSMAEPAEDRAGVGRRRVRSRQGSLAYTLIFLIVAYLAVFILFPIAQQFLTSFSNNVVGIDKVQWVGLRNYERLFDDDDFWFSVQVTLFYMAFVVVGAVSLGLLSALLLNRKFAGRNLARSAIAVPWAFPEISAVLVFIWMCNPTFGVMNVFARLFPGIDTNLNWLSDPNLAMPLAIAISIWKAFPFTFLVILAALQAIPRDVYEAAEVDGANRLQALRYVTIPEITPTLLLMAVLMAIFSFKQFTLIWLTTGGGPYGGITETLVLRIYQTAFRFFDLAYGATLGVAAFVIVLGLTILFVIAQQRLDRSRRR